MSTNLFFQNVQDNRTTLSELDRLYRSITADQLFCLFAYATMSGLHTFELNFGQDFWENVPTRWLFGVDYGRTQPAALRAIMNKPNAEVRIHDGEWICTQEGYVPRQDFHLKISYMISDNPLRYGVVAGSGNFSANGLTRSVEAGISCEVSGDCDGVTTLQQGLDAANSLWEAATPILDIIDQYDQGWRNSFARRPDGGPDIQIPGERNTFWIEAGYVTRNRGPLRPGNQIDLPRGMSHYFGIFPAADTPLNSVLGEIVFQTPNGQVVERNLRLGNNSMEKITLPIPETHGYQIYDGKIIVFQRNGGAFQLRALEIADFEAAYGDRLGPVMEMGSGRLYGHIEE
ncbi:HKD family nuclease [Roseovarius nanhaiticus]|uniref:HKD family nuclease n=1 Tax=Roseovarius nanhaiticus TaxID=573024 RepID=A0A1N7HKQ2_9RHOB|nr:hypothetical protein [Roseovarius nanhaiticus]SEL25903.1 HKD family nuclease [Roseovarius nanhaiticus]SIS25383.1 HKD family nuclease [Roseovarius nanhaiticus]